MTSQQQANELLAEHQANRERRRLDQLAEERHRDLSIIRKCLQRTS
jgi:hypothetical protein